MFEIQNSIFYQKPLAFRTRLLIHGLITSVFFIELVFNSPTPDKESLSNLFLASTCIIINIEIFLIHSFCQGKYYLSFYKKSSDESLALLISMMNSNLKTSKVRVLAITPFQARLNCFDSAFRIAIDENEKRYYVFIESVPAEEFIGDLYQLHSKRFTLKQKYAVIPLTFETNHEELKAS